MTYVHGHMNGQVTTVMVIPWKVYSEPIMLDVVVYYICYAVSVTQEDKHCFKSQNSVHK